MASNEDQARTELDDARRARRRLLDLRDGQEDATTRAASRRVSRAAENLARAKRGGR